MGVNVGASSAGWQLEGHPDKFSARSHVERLLICRASIEALHPGKSHLLSKGVTVAWGLTPYSEGVGVMWPGGPGRAADRGPGYQELLKAEGPVVFAGEHLSYQPTWQEGAALSAHEALKLVAAMTKSKAA
jgi:monoamine oxidase